MMDIITSQSTIDLMMSLLKSQSEYAYTSMTFFVSLINYYSFSSLNGEEGQSA